MVIIPIRTALTLARPPVVTYITAVLCVLIFLAQLGIQPLTEQLMYYPHSWNPFNMVTSALVHGGWMHLIGNLVFYLAFAPALEVMLESRIQYVWIMVVVAVSASIGYSISMALGGNPDIPTLGFSGVVTGMIGLSAYMMPKARIRVLWWYFIGAGIIHVPAWILAAFFIGMDAWTMFTVSDYGGVNIVAHVVGGVAGYLYGFFRLRERKEEISEELDKEIKAMEVRRKYGKDREEAHRSKEVFEQREAAKARKQDHDRFMGRLYQMVKTHRDSEAVLHFIDRFGPAAPVLELEELFKYMQAWGPSRFQLCIGRLMIDILDREKRYGKVLMYIESCQAISPQFLVADVSRVLFYAQMALDAGKPEVAKNLVENPAKRYGRLLNADQCNHFLQKAKAQI